jgi:hypothetical protein
MIRSVPGTLSNIPLPVHFRFPSVSIRIKRYRTW